MLKKCSNCGDEKSELILDFGSIPITSLLGKKDSFSLQYRKCEKCLVTHVFNSPPPNILYGGDYNFFSSSSTAYISYVSEIIKTIQTNIDLDQSDVLEIGCNDGTLLREIASKAKSVVGIDPFSLVTETFDCDINNTAIINDYFDSQAIKSYNLIEKFDVVVVNNVITHVDDVFDFLKALSLVVKNNGIIYFEICDYKKVIENDRFDYFYHGVTNLILPNQIEKLLINFQCIADYGFDSFDPFSRKFILQKTSLNNKEYKFEAKLFVRAGETQGMLRVLLVERAEREHDHDVHEDVRTDEKVSAGGEESWIQRDSDSWANVAAEKARRVE